MKPRPRPKDFEFFYAPTPHDGRRYAWLRTRVEVDHNNFHDCTFGAGCVLVYRGQGAAGFSHCTFSEGHQWGFEDSASNTVAFLRALAQAGPAGRLAVEQLCQTLLS